MRILLSIDTDKSLIKLSRRVLSVYNSFNKSAMFIDIFHVYEKPSVKGGHIPNTMSRVIQREHEQKMDFLANCERKLEVVIKELSNKKTLVNSYLETGDYLKKLQQQVARYQYDLLILLPGDKDSLEMLLNGRNTQKVFSKIDVPILMLPKNRKIKHAETKFVWCLDKPDTKIIDKKSMYFLNLIEPSQIKYLHFCKTTPTNRKGNVHIIQSDDPLKSLKRYDKEHKENHIYILNPKKRTGLKRYFEKSFTKGILKDPQFSFLLI